MQIYKILLLLKIFLTKERRKQKFFDQIFIKIPFIDLSLLIINFR